MMKNSKIRFLLFLCLWMVSGVIIVKEFDLDSRWVLVPFWLMLLAWLLMLWFDSPRWDD